MHEWLSSPDLALCLNASKALANMDRDFEAYKYHDGVYVYHPLHRSRLAFKLVLIIYKNLIVKIVFYAMHLKITNPFV